METEAMEKCMTEPVHPLIKGKSHAVATPKLLGLMKPTMQHHHHVPANFQKLYVPSVYPYNVADPVWRTKMTTMFNDCIDMAESLPESIFENNPMLRMMGPLGRFMKFMMCKKMCTKHLCGAAQAARMVEKFHGSEMNFDASAFGAKDKYEKAMMVAMVMTESKSPLESFMEQVFHGEK